MMAEEHSPERDVAELAERNEHLEQEIEQTRADWERKRRDGAVPGAPPPPEDTDED
jgi:uncharacterized small protein (DUF1192 family)